MTSADGGPITLRELGRATLARQHLLARTDRTPLQVIERLAGLQAQDVDAPYAGLWSRINGFTPPDLAALLEDRSAVRVLAMRGTIHLLSDRDARGLQPVCAPVFARELKAVRVRALTAAGADPDAIAERCAQLLAADERPQTARDLAGAIMAEHPEWPESVREHVAAVPRLRLAVVQVPPRGVWGKGGPPAYRPLEDWTGAPLDPYPLTEVVRRYLAAFGPATVKDAQQWSGLTRLKATFDELEPDLVTFTGPAGETLYDLPDAPRPGGDVEAPLRIIPPFDNLLLAHADRTRVLEEPVRQAMRVSNGMVPGAVLIDGSVAALAKTARGTPGHVRIVPMRRLTRGERAAMIAEAERLLDGLGDGYAGGAIRIEPTGDRWRQ